MQRWCILSVLVSLLVSLGGTTVSAGTGQRVAPPRATHDAALPPPAAWPAAPDEPQQEQPTRAAIGGFDGSAVFEQQPALQSAAVITATDSLTLTGETANANLGTAVSTAGDVNGDGYADVLVGVPGEREVLVYYGSAAGIDFASTATASLSGADDFGAAVSIAGDVNGDGYSDVVVGTPATRQIAVYHGAAGGLSDSADFSATEATVAGFASVVATAGDVNGDGYADVLVGAPGAATVFLYTGSAAGLTEPPLLLQGAASFGVDLDTAGDVNGDGYADVLVGAPEQNQVYVYLGSTSSLSTTASFTATQRGDFGTAVSTAGDVNGDGYSDLLVGAPTYTTTMEVGEPPVMITPTLGAAFVYFGTAEPLTDTTAIQIDGPQDNAGFGTAVSTAGDVNGDNLADMIIGSPSYTATITDTGAAFVYLGAQHNLATEAYQTYVISGTATEFGAAVNTAGDLNGDGYAEIIIGAPAFAAEQPARANAGAARIVSGAVSPIQTTVSNQVLNRSDIGGVNAYGAFVNLAGDVNGDGFDDFLVADRATLVDLYYGAPDGVGAVPGVSLVINDLGLGPAESFSLAFGSAGDVNGDGYAEVILGAPNFDEQRGIVAVFAGSPDGLITPPVWTMEGENPGDRFGEAVNSAGDVNGDGLADVLIGAIGFDREPALIIESGKLYAYYGTDDGSYLPNEADWTAIGLEEKDNLGFAVNNAGDVNGDGFSDVVVSMTRGTLSRPGVVLIFLGSASGLSDLDRRPVGTSDNADFLLTAGGDSDDFGFSVDSAGDVNGDGYADVLISALEGQRTRGKHFLYYGSPSPQGVLNEPDWLFVAQVGNYNTNNLSSTAGDVNGDGYADIVVCQREDRQALVFFGSANGPSAQADVVLHLDIFGFGYTVSTTGDTNGDGLSDIVVGSSSQVRAASRADVFYGSGNVGLGLAPQQRQVADPDTPVAVLGKTDLLTATRLSLRGHMPLGTAPVRLEWQLAKQGQGFTATDVITGFSDVVTTGVVISPTVTGVEVGENYTWRLRLHYAAGNRLGQTVSRWFSLASQAVTEKKFGTGVAVGLVNDGPNPINSATVLTATLQGATPVTYTWDFGDGTPIMTTKSRVIDHVYTAIDQYLATVTVTFTLPGSSELLTLTAQTLVEAAIATVQSPDVGIVEHSTSLTATITGLEPVAFIWDFEGDGVDDLTVSEDVTATNVLTYAYPEIGVFTPTVQVETVDDVFEASTSIAIIEVPLDSLEVANDSPNGALQTTMLTATALGARPVTVVSYTWDLGDGSPVLVRGDPPGDNVISKTYTLPGFYTAIVTASNGFMILTRTTQLTITEVPIAGLQASNDSPSPLGSPSRLAATVQQGTGITYTWDFESDGIVDAQAGGLNDSYTVAHIYPALGFYTATVVALNNTNGPFTRTTQVTITEAPVMGLQMQANPITPSLGTEVQFTATVADGTNVRYSWDFGDDTSGSGPAPTHTYNSLGTYEATVTASNDANEASATVTIMVTDVPIQGLTLDTSSPTRQGEATTFAASVEQGTNVSYSWNFGDGASAMGQQVSHTYDDTGDYLVTVTASNGMGNVEATETVRVVVPVLEIGKQSSHSDVQAGDQITYTLAVTNTGSALAGSVVITDQLPAGVSLVQALDGGTRQGQQVRWEVGDLATGAATSVRLVVQVEEAAAEAGSVVNEFYGARESGGDQTSGNRVTVQVAAPAFSVWLPIVIKQTGTLQAR